MKFKAEQIKKLFSDTCRDDKVIKERKQNHRRKLLRSGDGQMEFWKVILHCFWWEEVDLWMLVVVYDLHANDTTFCIIHDLNMKCPHGIMWLITWSLLLALFW